ncbi:hypothetical protein HYALB_00004225 [Hymenoscyphus albidus]|uniref:Uncharacterized protein n=1 Tax=Hymenoscyphus albidus TaxID=595503 RepID=A0A9N9QE69_9HELO|nr:hypothetical protein HYALB_00004225 [Hymenoscyphus albidus]
MPYPVPVELLLPFGNFAEKYNIQSFIPLVGILLRVWVINSCSRLRMFARISAPILLDIQIGFLTSEQRDNSLLYEHAAAELEGSLQLNSEILAVDRDSSEEAKVLVQMPSGNTMIKTSKLFSNSGYYTAITRNSGLPENVSVVIVSPESEYQLGSLPGIYKVPAASIPGSYNVKYGSIEGKQYTKVEIAVYSSHTPFELTVPPYAIANGFHKELCGLQGQRHTYYTGAAFHIHDSSFLWQFSEKLLPNKPAS